jgi:ATP-dependent DNA helicase PIF1
MHRQKITILGKHNRTQDGDTTLSTEFQSPSKLHHKDEKLHHKNDYIPIKVMGFDPNAQMITMPDLTAAEKKSLAQKSYSSTSNQGYNSSSGSSSNSGYSSHNYNSSKSNGKLQKPKMNQSITTPINMENIDEFIAGYDTYHAEPQCEAKLHPREKWWFGAKYCPSESLRTQMKVDEELMWRILNSQRHILISGKAGAGKSHLLKRFVATCEATMLPYALCAPTGIAAFNIGGETLHRRLGLGLANDDPVTLFRSICAQRKKYARTWKFLTSTEILIIDEISMVHAEFFEKIEYLFRKARNSAEPFGGVTVIMVGDFTQLGPITERKFSDPREDEPAPARFVLDSETWQRMSISRIFLNRSYRQKEGDAFLDLLNEVRTGHLSEKGRALLLSRVNADIKITQAIQTTQTVQDYGGDNDMDEDDGDDTKSRDSEDDKDQDNNEDGDREDSEEKEEKTIKSKQKATRQKVYTIQPLNVYPKNYMVDRTNTANLEALVKRDNVQVHKFFPSLRVAKREHAPTLDPADYERGQYLISKDGIKQLQDYFPLFYLTLAEGAQIQCKTNKFFELGIFNGSTGIITSIEANFISVLFVVNGKFLDHPIEVPRVEMAARVGKTAEVIMTQYPLMLAYAITTHRCQGLTLDSARVSLRECFEAGQFYVAISRVRKLEDLSLIDFDEDSIMADPRAVAFETDPEKKMMSHATP